MYIFKYIYLYKRTYSGTHIDLHEGVGEEI